VQVFNILGTPSRDKQETRQGNNPHAKSVGGSQMKKGNLVKFIEWNDPYKGKVGVVLQVRDFDAWVYLPETNEKRWRIVRHLELVK